MFPLCSRMVCSRGFGMYYNPPGDVNKQTNTKKRDGIISIHLRTFKARWLVCTERIRLYLELYRIPQRKLKTPYWYNMTPRQTWMAMQNTVNNSSHSRTEVNRFSRKQTQNKNDVRNSRSIAEQWLPGVLCKQINKCYLTGILLIMKRRLLKK